MNEKTFSVSVKDGEYRIQKSELSEFELIGILECIVLDLKFARADHKRKDRKSDIAEPKQESVRESGTEAGSQTAQSPPKEAAQEQGAPDIKMRIGNAVKAIRSLGGEAAKTDLSNLTNEELQAELEELKNQYKRLKGSHKPK